MDYSLLKGLEVFFSQSSTMAMSTSTFLTTFYLKSYIIVLAEALKPAISSFDALNSLLPTSFTNWSAFSCNMGPKMGSFLQLISLNHSQINLLISSLYIPVL